MADIQQSGETLKQKKKKKIAHSLFLCLKTPSTSTLSHTLLPPYLLLFPPDIVFVGYSCLGHRKPQKFNSRRLDLHESTEDLPVLPERLLHF